MTSSTTRSGLAGTVLAAVLAIPGAANAVPALTYLISNSIALPGSTILAINCLSTTSFNVTVGNPGGAGSFMTSVNTGGVTIDECAGAGAGSGAQQAGQQDLEDFANAAVQQGVQINNLANIRRIFGAGGHGPGLDRGLFGLVLEALANIRRKEELLEAGRLVGDEVIPENDPGARAIAQKLSERNLAEFEIEQQEEKIEEQDKQLAQLKFELERVKGQRELINADLRNPPPGTDQALLELRSKFVNARVPELEAKIAKLEQERQQAKDRIADARQEIREIDAFRREHAADEARLEAFGEKNRALIEQFKALSKELDKRNEDILREISNRTTQEQFFQINVGIIDAAQTMLDNIRANRESGSRGTGAFRHVDLPESFGLGGIDRQSAGHIFAQSAGSAIYPETVILRAFEPQRFKVWVTTDYVGFDDDALAGTDGKSGGLSVGATYVVDEALTLGLAAQYRRLASESPGTGSHDGNFLGLSALASLRTAGGVDVTGILSFERGLHTLRFAGALSDFKSDTITVGIEAGKTFFLGNGLWARPEGTVIHSWSFRDSFVDSGGTFAPSDTLTQGLASFGGAAGMFITVRENGLLGIEPSLDLRGHVEFNRDPGNDRFGGSVLASLDVVFENHISLAASAGFTQLGDDFSAWTVSLTGDIPF